MINPRPDLVQARKRLESSYHRARAAQKSLLPALRLTGSSGTRSADLGKLLDPGYLASSIASSISQSLFEGGTRRADARAALARNKDAILDYSNVALRAFREVDSDFASANWLTQHASYLR